MDSSRELAALASRLSSLANALTESSDPSTDLIQQQALVQEAKNVVHKYQDPLGAILDHITNASTIGAISASMEIGVFEAVPEAGSATIQEVAEKCESDRDLIIRLMRQLTCQGIFEEVKLNEWAHNKYSMALSGHGESSGKYLYMVAMDEMMPPILQLNKYIKAFGKNGPATYTNTPHSWQHNMVGRTFWEVLGSDPKRLDLFNRGLSLFSAKHPPIAIFPFEERLRTRNSADRPLAVDIGGGRGLAMLELRKTCPSLQGEIILQERQVVLDQIQPDDLPGVTKMAHDFFTEQPVKNAQMYYFRRVFHDWVDEDAAKILQCIKPAMASDSRIVISDMALPEPVTPADSHAIWLDLMMLAIGGKERTKRDWIKLGEMSGLKLVNIWQDHEKYGPLAKVEYMLPQSTEPSIHVNGVSAEENAHDGHTNGVDTFENQAGEKE